MNPSLLPSRGLALLALAWLVLVGAAPLLRLLSEASGPALALLPADAAVWRATWRTVAVAAGACLLACLLGMALVSLLLLRAPPGRRVLLFLCILPALVPPQVLALAFSQAAGPSSPLLLALGLAPPLGTPNPLYGPGGMIALLGLQGAPLVLLAMAAVLRRVPGENLAAARGLGAGPSEALRRVVWPLLLPGLLAGAGLAWIAALGNFGVAALLGIPARWITLPILIWQRLSGAGTGALGQSAALSLLLAALAAPGLLAQRAAIRAASLPSGKPFEPLRAGQGARLGVALLWLGLVLVLLVPLLSLLAASLVPAFGVPISAGTATLRHWGAAFAPGSQTLGALGNSLLLSALAALILALAALPVAISLRGRAVRIGAIGTDLSYALPGACTGVAALLLVLSTPFGGWAYGTLALILFAYLARFQAMALRPAAAAAARLDPLLDFAARGMGAGLWSRLRSVHLPPLTPGLAAGGILVALQAVNEVTISTLLHGPGTQTLGVLVFNLQDGGDGPQAAAVSLVALLLVAGLMALASLFARRLPDGTLPWRP
ncbi:Iron(III)-transport system permease protein sfuB [Roseomonas mucosa]|uniref:2-aminoethylphosphonate transport system permease PhnU n=2 Tax=Roseomonas TaxID=125216 RepID=A0A379N4Q8_9PROT|nr:MULTISPECIES: ABC transporter permease subunit [Roseomonas]AWV23792.1 Iron(III)-transport system permease protein sfuB [Roseomonas mucosa]MCG7353413.1 ABC transporter permease subunit [Roseomonas mucosa]MCG7358496.1 ABC transporter permease subunit [Roseomonas mucosa]MDT8275021.1 ABC transporter permease subunit [Roseomonas mucosa]MDT8290803.1 ABC transporter permease subunit [Roseomonas mucosa]